MPGESLSFPIFAPDHASRNIREVGDAAAGTAAKLDIAAASAKLWNDTTVKSGKAADTALASMKAHTDATKLLADAEAVLAGKATTTTKLLADQGRSFDNTAKKADSAAKSVGGLAGTGGAGGGLAGGGMGALIGAAVALAPVIATVGTGLTGLGAAAYGIYKPIANAAQATGGLQKNMARLNPEQQQVARGILALGKTFAGFQNALQPTVLGDFNQGLHLASVLLHDIEPVSAATGKALGGLIAQVSATFQGGTWQQFFAFMARTAGPDIQLLTKNFTDLLNALPPLVMQLQPVATSLLTITDATVKLVGHLATYTQHIDQTSQHENALAKVTDMLRTVLFAPGAGLLAALKLLHITGGSAAAGVAAVITPAQVAAHELQAMATATTALMTAQQKALNTQVTYGSDLVTTANDAIALQKALHKSHDEIGLHTAAQRNSFSTANTYITDLGNTATAAYQSGHGVDASISAIKRGLPILDSAKTKNRQYWQEVQTLVGWLHRLETIKAIRETVYVSGSGTFTVRPGTSVGLPGGTAGGPFAAGGRVPAGFPNDTYLARLTSGEAVVPARLTPAVAPFLKAHGVPGFAAGGLVGSYGGSVGGLMPWSRTDLNATVSIFEHSIAKATLAGMRAAASTAFGMAGPGGGNPAANATLAQRMYPAWGSGPEWYAWNAVAMRESGWNQFARNPSSGAYGIPQAYPASKMGAAANPPMSNPAAQISWMIGYIRSTYGDPIGAWNSEITRGWYDDGGYLPPGLSLALNTTGHPERVGGGNTYNIHVHVPPSANKADMGRQVVEVIREYEKRSGAGWRR